MEKGQLDVQSDVPLALSSPDPMSSLVQTVKGHKILATPAVRRVAMEHKVFSVFFDVKHLGDDQHVNSFEPLSICL